MWLTNICFVGVVVCGCSFRVGVVAAAALCPSMKDLRVFVFEQEEEEQVRFVPETHSQTRKCVMLQLPL